jgi:hypothetical protein
MIIANFPVQLLRHIKATLLLHSHKLRQGVLVQIGQQSLPQFGHEVELAGCRAGLSGLGGIDARATPVRRGGILT